jgi:hypothetical protein
MVQAILEGRKTMTRRIVKPQPEEISGDMLNPYQWYAANKGDTFGDIDRPLKCPYGKVGNILWVRENYYQYGKWVNNGRTKTGKQKRKFQPLEEEILFSDTEEVLGETFHLEMGDRSTGIPGWFKRIGRFMPKKYARTFLQITDIRVERLQDISEEDAVAEGVESFELITDKKYYRDYLLKRLPYQRGYTKAILSFKSLWELINSPESWVGNPFVWVVSFEKIDKPE